jgi:hypothetical protein
MTRYLEGRVQDDPAPDDSDRGVRELREEVRGLQQDVERAERAYEQAQRQADASKRALVSLRRQLTPLYRALQAVFGDLDEAGVAATDASDGRSAPIPRHAAIWDSWKAKMPGRTAQVIDALLVHGQMNSTQIGIAIGIHRNNVPPLMTRLNKAGLISKNGHFYSLKEL